MLNQKTFDSMDMLSPHPKNPLLATPANCDHVAPIREKEYDVAKSQEDVTSDIRCETTS